jgi:hypothetical protein
MSEAKVEAIMANFPADLERMSTEHATLFPHASLSVASAAFAAQLDVKALNNAGNASVTQALNVVRDEIAAAVNNILVIERWIALSTPQMEDGNNFGVSVQMIVAKYLSTEREALAKVALGLPDYFDKRAGAMEKIPSAPSKVSLLSYLSPLFAVAQPRNNKPFHCVHFPLLSSCERAC